MFRKDLAAALFSQTPYKQTRPLQQGAILSYFINCYCRDLGARLAPTGYAPGQHKKFTPQQVAIISHFVSEHPNAFEDCIRQYAVNHSK